jgi:hypothetical protein
MSETDWSDYRECLICGADAGGRCRSRRAPRGRVDPIPLNRPHTGRARKTPTTRRTR